MFYNTYRATQSAMKRRTFSARPNLANPKERLMNTQKRQKLKELLISKFMQKYNVKNPNEILSPVITEFIQQEKLNDVDLKRLDIRIKNLLKDKNSKDNLKNTLTRNLQDIQPSRNPIQTEVNTENLQSNNVINQPDQNIKNDSQFPSINQANTNAKQNAYSGTVSQTETNVKKRGYSSYLPRGRRMNCFKSPEEELAQLEKELAEEEEKVKGKRHNYERIDFAKDGDEWAAIVKYNKKLYDIQLMDEKLKDKVNKRRTKEYLDYQVREKIKKEYEDELKEKEYNKIMEEHTKKMDELETIKAQKIKEQIQRLKDDRDAQLKNERTRKRIEELKQKKFDLNLVKNMQNNLEKDWQHKMDRRQKEYEAFQKAMKENEMKQQRLKEQLKKEKEDEIKTNKERLRIEDRKDQERKRYYDQIKLNGNKYSTKQAEEIIEKMKRDQKAEDDKIQYYYDAKNKEANEKEVKEHIRRQKEREGIKRYLDMQIEERKKEEHFLKLLDEEQARIWNIDCKKYHEDEQLAEKKIKLMNKINFDCLMNQIEEKKRSKSKRNIMTNNEYALNRDLLENVKKEEENPTPLPQPQA